MSRTKQEKKIVQSIIFLPILSIIILSIIIFTSFIIYINNFQKEQIKELTESFINKKKGISKSRVIDLENGIKINIQHLNIKIQKNLKERIDEATAIIDAVLSNHPHKDKDQIKDEIAKILNSIRYNKGRGYYFAFDKDSSITTVHSIKKYINKDMSNFRDKRGTLLTKKILEIVNTKGEGYMKCYFAKPAQPDKEFEKIIFVRYIPALNWVIGTGEYIKDAENELKQNILEKIEHKRFGDSGYFWVHSENGILLAHPYRKKDIGKYDLDLTDIKGTKIIKLFIDKAKENPQGAFVKYYWKNPKTGEIEEKISFVKELKEWKWIIGTGIYVNDIKTLIAKSTLDFKKKINRLYIFIALIITISLLMTIILSLFLSKQTKKLFVAYKEDLEKKVKKAVEESKQKDKMLQQQSKLASMGEMIGSIAHQWRQPLNALGINIQNLEDDYEEGLINEKFLEKFVEKNMQIVKYMSNTIDDFRNFFKIDKTKFDFSIKNTIKQVLEIQSATLKNHNIKVSLEVEDFLVNGFESEFKQVILNIINNAKDAIIENGIKEGEISIKIDKPFIIIEDNAGGIPKDIIDRIFEPYFTTKEQGKGTGIGLYMSKMIIEQNMNGSLNVENGKKGAKFIIEIKE